ncbi:hypothetical protein [Leptothermofonsia sp. ETS-13]|uniref:hypothetical protein n=1 Tax=Leptothermofonsia sp. ETS-13 TaxID=3035696 RepID=UPI003BA285EC
MFPHFKSWLRLTLALAFAPSLAGSLPLAVAQTTALPIPEDLRKVCNLLTRRKSEKGELLVFVIESNIKPCEQTLAHYRQSKNRDRSIERQILWDLAKTYRWLGRDSQAIHYISTKHRDYSDPSRSKDRVRHSHRIAAGLRSSAEL